MSTMKRIDFGVRRMGMACLLMAGMFLMSCSSAPESQPDPSKEEVRQDADRFFKKIEKEETQSKYPE